MAPRALIVTLFHLLFVPIVWAVVLPVAVRTRYDFSGIERAWMAVYFSAAVLFRVMVTVELLFVRDVVLLHISRERALRTADFILKFHNTWIMIGTLWLMNRRWLVSLGVSKDGSNGCFLAFLLIGYYEMITFIIVLLWMRSRDSTGRESRTVATD